MSFPTLEFEQSSQPPSYLKNDINKVQNPLQTYAPQSSFPSVPIGSPKSVFVPAREDSVPTDHLPSVVAKTSSFTNGLHTLSQNQTNSADHDNLKNNYNIIAPTTVQIQNQVLPTVQGPLDYQIFSCTK